MNTRAINRLFERLAATYGAAWDRALGTAPLPDVKTVWADVLNGFSDKLHAVAWALENLPERCPNVIEFRNLCRRAPSLEALALPPPPSDPQRLRAELAKLEPLIDAMRVPKKIDGKAWARRLQARHAGGGLLTTFQIESYRAALGARSEEAL